MNCTRGDIDDNNMTECWMDRSIRMRLRNNHDVEDDDGSSVSTYSAIAVPPSDDCHQLSNNSDGDNDDDNNNQAASSPTEIADIVGDTENEEDLQNNTTTTAAATGSNPVTDFIADYSDPVADAFARFVTNFIGNADDPNDEYPEAVVCDLTEESADESADVLTAVLIDDPNEEPFDRSDDRNIDRATDEPTEEVDGDFVDTPAPSAPISSDPIPSLTSAYPAPTAPVHPYDDTTSIIRASVTYELDEDVDVQNNESIIPQNTTNHGDNYHNNTDSNSPEASNHTTQRNTSVVNENVGVRHDREGNEVRMVQRTGLQPVRGRVRRNNFRTNSATRLIIPRTSLPYTIEQNTTTSKWMAIISVNQEVVDEKSDYAETEDTNSVVILNSDSIQEAREACHAYAPPRMHPIKDYNHCHLCKKKFGLMRRPLNCKNCGICVCSNCSVLWPASMIPVTYQWKKPRKSVKVCLGCDWLNDTFRMSLLDGNFDKAVALYYTGNVNLRCPFAKGKNEI